MSCVYKWAGVPGSAENTTLIHEAVSKVATNIEGWEAMDTPSNNLKQSWLASGGLNSTFTIQLNDIEEPVNGFCYWYVHYHLDDE